MSVVAETATLAHGYTMDDIDRLTRVAVSQSRPSSLIDSQDRYECAWSGVVEKLYCCGCGRGPEHCTRVDPLTSHDLIGAGMNAVRSLLNDEHRHHGSDRSGGTGPHFEKYWAALSGPDDFTERLTERLALPQVLSQLTGSQYEALVALAALGSQKAAAPAIGISEAAFSGRIITARAVIRKLWLAPETPPSTAQRKLTPDGRCNVGHDMIEHGVVVSGRLRCRLCQRNSARRQRAKKR